MEIKCFAEHSICPELLTGGIVIDAGARGFLFSEAMSDLGETVYAFDLEEMTPRKDIRFIKAAIMAKTGCVKFVNTHDLQAKYIHENGTIEVEGISINLLVALLGDDIDVLKLDVEGVEIEILLSLKKPVARQISFETHIHTGTPMSDIRKVFTHLHDIGYTKVFEDYSEKHGLERNFWDTLFIRNDLC